MGRIFKWIMILLSFAYSVTSYGDGESQLITQSCRCIPSSGCWPTESQWLSLGKQLSPGALVKPELLTTSCQVDVNSKQCVEDLKKIKNPFYIQTKPGGTQTQGWYNAWDTTPSIYAIEAKSTSDVVAAVDFARIHNLKLVIKGGGHDYLGRSSAPNSLLVWTHDMRNVEYQDNFVPRGAPSDTKGIKTITVGAGTRWIEAYTVATTKHNLYVQGGGCASVGAAGGFTQGGGFGSFSKKFGTGAGGIVEVEVVTADGKVLIANQFQNKDLFWAIRGGGGGAYGVVTKMTLRLHQLPKIFGIYTGKIIASNDEAYSILISKFLAFYHKSLNNEYWGEQFSFDNNNQLSIFMVFQGLSQKEVNQIWKPFLSWVKSSPKKYKVSLNSYTIPPNKMWDYNYWNKHHPELVTKNTAPGNIQGEFWWSPNTAEVSQYIYTYQSWWLPDSLFSDKDINNLSNAFFKASRIAPLAVHINKGLYGAESSAIRLALETSTNPKVYEADALVIMSAGTSGVYKGVKGHELNTLMAKNEAEKISKAMRILIDLAPDSGTYVNEADYFQPNWQHVFWGKNYPNLYNVKQKYDPNGLFYCRHCVGSELWDKTGMCKR